MDAGTLLLRVLDDLRERSEAELTDEYAVVRAAGLLRMLLLDGNRLVDVVNRDHRVKVTYEVRVNVNIRGGGGDFSSMHFSLEPVVQGMRGLTTRVTRDGLLKRRLHHIQWHDYDVQQTIQFGANVLGGIHYCDPRDDDERRLMKSLVLFPGGDDGLDAIHRSIAGISRVVLTGLTPLVEAVRSRAV